jgi:1,4-alpha-glucan branching enzyme
MTTLKGNGVVEFRFYRPAAASVLVQGDFNRWQGASLPMRPLGDGWWQAEAPLPPGEYRFRYLADGRWYTDYASHGVELGPGGWNAVLVVPGKCQAKIPAALGTDELALDWEMAIGHA